MNFSISSFSITLYIYINVKIYIYIYRICIYQNLSKEENEKKQQYGCERYKNLSEDLMQQKLVACKKKIIEWEKMPYYNYKKVF